MKRRLCVLTGTRAEYGLLRWLIQEIEEDPGLDLQLLVTGMHLSSEFGLTYREIERDGFEISEKVEMLLSSDSAVAISKSMALGTIGFAEALHRLRPEILVLLGDRFEVLAAAQAALITRVPVAHLYGGEATEGLIDEPIRHAVTKMSHFHFVTADAYHRRVIQLGEDPDRVFNHGAPGLDNLERLDLLDVPALETEIGVRLSSPVFLVTYHPVTLDRGDPGERFAELLSALDEFPGTLVFTKSNADTKGRVINRMIDDYTAARPGRTAGFVSLGQRRYLSLMKHADVVVGNSSSGLLEAPSLRTPTVNVGPRQRGRLRAASVLDSETNREEIVAAIGKALSPEFRRFVEDVVSPYGEPGASRRIKDTLKEISLDDVLMKRFYDLPEQTS